MQKSLRAAPTPPPEERLGPRQLYATMRVTQIDNQQQQTRDVPFELSLPQLRQWIHDAFDLNSEQLNIVEVFVVTNARHSSIQEETQWQPVLAFFPGGSQPNDLDMKFITVPRQPLTPNVVVASQFGITLQTAGTPQTAGIPQTDGTSQIAVNPHTTPTSKAVWRSGLPKDDTEFLKLYKIGEGQDGTDPPTEPSIAKKHKCDRTNVSHRLKASLDRVLYVGAGKAWSLLRRAGYPGPSFNSQASFQFVESKQYDENGQARSADDIAALARQVMEDTAQGPTPSASIVKSTSAPRSQRMPKAQATPSRPRARSSAGTPDSAAPFRRPGRPRRPSRLAMEAFAGTERREDTAVEDVCEDDKDEYKVGSLEVRMEIDEETDFRSVLASVSQLPFGEPLRRKTRRYLASAAYRNLSPASKQRKVDMLEQELACHHASRDVKGNRNPRLAERAVVIAGETHDRQSAVFWANTTYGGRYPLASAPLFPDVPAISVPHGNNSAVDPGASTPSALLAVEDGNDEGVREEDSEDDRAQPVHENWKAFMMSRFKSYKKDDDAAE